MKLLIVSTRGSHHKLQHPNNPQTIILPVHGKDMKKGFVGMITMINGIEYVLPLASALKEGCPAE
ncbi:type II toxin-antitoxin system HicA family toxin [Allobaculum sp. JKK-2023]|uniref:type II toxin-antitoxin system HicA family toxin n=1 Tax=Allobaculum sp. JKK-2023 TaxID=3108943 RepID=UPI003A598EA4